MRSDDVHAWWGAVLEPVAWRMPWASEGTAARLWSGRLRAGRAGGALELRWAATAHTVRARRGEPSARIAGPPGGELLLYLFGRRRAAQVDVDGPAEAVEALRRARFGR